MDNKNVKKMMERTYNKGRKNGFLAFGMLNGTYCAIEWGWTGNPPDDFYDYAEKMKFGAPISLTAEQLKGK